MKLTPTIVRQMDLHRSLRAALLEIVFMANGRASIRTTQETLAKRLSISSRSVRRQLEALEIAGLIKRSENRSQITGFKAAPTIELPEVEWSVVPAGARRQADKMSGWIAPAKRSGCPVGQADKMSAYVEDSSKSRDLDHESGHRAGDAQQVGATTASAANDASNLRLILGGKAA